MKKLLLLLLPICTFAQNVPDATIKTNTNTLIRNATTVTRANHSLINDELTDSKLSRIENNQAAGTNTYSINLSWVTAYNKGLTIPLFFTNSNTGASTLNVSSLGNISIRSSGTLLTGGEIKSNLPYFLIYDGTYFELLSGGGGSSGFPFGSTSGTNTYTTTITGIASYITNSSFMIKFTIANSGAATLNINSLGAVTIAVNGASLTGGEIAINETYLLTYDGTNFQLKSNLANSSTPGAVILFTATGNNTTGTMDQNSITNAINAVSGGSALGTDNQVGALGTSVYGLTNVIYAKAMTTTALPAYTYSSGVITETGFGHLPAIDGISIITGDNIIVNNNGLDNGIYNVTNEGGAFTHFVLTRRTDVNTPSTLSRVFLYVLTGTVNGIKYFWQPTVLSTFGVGTAPIFTPLYISSLHVIDEQVTNYNPAKVGEFIPGDLTSGSLTIQLPTAPVDGAIIGTQIVKLGGAYNITVSTGGSDVFDKSGGPTSKTLNALGQTQTYKYKASGAIWYVINNDGNSGTLANALTVDNSSLQFNSGTTFDGSIAKTISVKASGITNSMLANSNITIAGNSTSLGSSVTLDQITGVSSNGYLKRTGANTLTNVSTVPDADLTVSYLKADGSRALSADWAAGTFSITGIKSFAISGTGGNGYGEFIAQSSNASAPSSAGFRLFAGSSGSFNWARKNGSDTFVRTFDATLTADRTFTLQDVSSTIAMYTNNLSVFASTTSSQLAGVLSDETGTGAAVFSGSPVFTGTPTLGTLGYSDTGIVWSWQSSTNSFNQVIIQNTNSGSTASTNYIISNDIGTASTHYGEFGKNSSGFTGSGSWNIASVTYLDDISDDVAIGTLANKTLHFFTGGSTTDRLAIDGSGVFTFNAPALGNIWTTTVTSTANNQISKQFTDNLTLRGTASDAITANYFNPTFTIASTTQNPIGLNLDVNYSQTGGISTLSSFNQLSTAGMTPGTYTSVSQSSTSGSGTGALFTIIVADAANLTSITVTTAGSGYKVNEVLTFNASLFGGSGTITVPVRSVPSLSVGTTATAIKVGVSGSNFLDLPKSINFFYQGSTVGSVGIGKTNASNSPALAFFDNNGAQSFYLLSGTTIFQSNVTINTLSVSGASTYTGTQTFQSQIVQTGTGLAASSNAQIATTGLMGGITATNVFQSKFKSILSSVTVGLVNTLSLTTGGTSGYTTGTGKATSGGSGSGCTINIITVSGGVITAINSAPTSRGTGYKVSDVLTVTSGSGDATVTVSTVDFNGSIVSFEDANPITDASSNNTYATLHSRPTYNITSTQSGATWFAYYNPTYTALGSFTKGGIAIVPTGTVNGIGTASPTGTLHLVGNGSNATLKTVGAGSATNYSIQSFQSNGTTQIFGLQDNGNATLNAGNFTLGTAGNKFFITEGTNGSVGQIALVSGIKAVSITGTTASSRCFVTLVSQGGTVTTTVDYSCACTSNTATITALTSAGATNTSDTSTLNYWIVN